VYFNPREVKKREGKNGKNPKRKQDPKDEGISLQQC
jgi:hypothetical protein